MTVSTADIGHDENSDPLGVEQDRLKVVKYQLLDFLRMKGPFVTRLK